MNERTRKKKLQQSRRRLIGGALAVLAVAFAFYQLTPVDSLRTVPRGSMAFNIKAEKVSAEPVAEDPAPSRAAPLATTPISTPEPTTLLLLAPTALLILRRTRRA